MTMTNGNIKRVKSSDIEFKDKLVAVNRVTKVTKGGRIFSFAAIVVVGNEDGVVGYGLGKAKEVTAAIAKGIDDAKKNLVNKIKDAYTKSDDAVRNQSDQLFSNPLSTNPELNFNTGFEEKVEIESKRLLVGHLLNNWNSDLANLTIDESDLTSFYNSAKSNLDEIDSFLNKLSFIVNYLSADSSTSQTTIDGYKTDIASARTNINTAISNLTTANEKLKTAESGLLLEEETLKLKKAGATNEQIKIQEAKVQSAQANVNNFGALIAKTIISSPINGIVTKKEVEKGEIVQPNVKVISVISGDNFKIEADIPEADIVKIKIGDIAKITLDAYNDNLIFQAKVIKIDPAETVIEGVSTYKTTLNFKDKDDRIRSGMTANIDILTGKKENVIKVPQRAVAEKNGEKFIKVVKNKEIKEVKVKTGLRGSDGTVEIVSGLSVGDEIVVFEK